MYIKVTNGVPEEYSIGRLRRDNPNVSFPQSPSDSLLADWDVYPCTRPEIPAHDPNYQGVGNGSFTQDANGDWSLPYVVSNLPQSEAETKQRSKRDALLAETDWWALSDHTMTQEQTDYRSDLRDVPQQAGFPFSVVWPTKP